MSDATTVALIDDLLGNVLEQAGAGWGGGPVLEPLVLLLLTIRGKVIDPTLSDNAVSKSYRRYLAATTGPDAGDDVHAGMLRLFTGHMQRATHSPAGDHSTPADYYVFGMPGEEVDTLGTFGNLDHPQEKDHVLVGTFTATMADARAFWAAAALVGLKAPVQGDQGMQLEAAVHKARILEERNRVLVQEQRTFERALDAQLAQIDRLESATDWELEGSMRKWIENNARSQGPSGWLCLERAAADELLARVILAHRDEVAGCLSIEERHDLQHALGHGKSERNHFVCGVGDRADFAGWLHMVDVGVAERGKDMNDGRDAVFRATTFGIEIARVLRG